ncbi:hypothetical protein [Trichocoleus sp. FACHB-591]|uniref:hypothetical protein n=1 Tax=Trichocoleus sp. FACHB-591 TaxID=2692872 RepID=UPI001A7E7BE1|nr:hypothetical protein [Trichocoleus sp. FACHB-591]
MAQLSRRLFSIAPRLLLAGIIAGSYRFVAYTTLYMFAVPPLLNSGSAIPTYAGFYLWAPSLTGKVSNLQCVTRGEGPFNYGYYCRFKARPTDILQFVREKVLDSGGLAGNPDWIYGCNPAAIQSPEELWWKPSELGVGGQTRCYSTMGIWTDELAYSPVSQIAYIRSSD